MCWALATHLSFWRPLAWSGLSISNPSVLCRDSLVPTGSLLSLWRSRLNGSSANLLKVLYLYLNVYLTIYSCFMFPVFLTLAWLSEYVENVSCDESDACTVSFDVSRRSGVHGKRVTLIPSTKGRIRPMTLISLMQKTPVIFHCNATVLVILD